MLQLINVPHNLRGIMHFHLNSSEMNKNLAELFAMLLENIFSSIPSIKYFLKCPFKYFESIVGEHANKI